MRKRSQSRGVVRIFVLASSLIFRLGVRGLLAECHGVLVVGESTNCVDAKRRIRRLKPDIVMVDLDMARESPLTILRESADLGLPTRFIVLSAAPDNPRIVEALRLGASGVMAKDGVLEQKIRAIRTVLRGQYWVNREVFSDVLASLRKSAQPHMPAQQNNFGLTAREREVIAAIVTGRTNKDVALEFQVSEETLKHHLTHIYEKLGVSNRLELTLFAIHQSLIVLR